MSLLEEFLKGNEKVLQLWSKDLDLAMVRIIQTLEQLQGINDTMDDYTLYGNFAVAEPRTLDRKEVKRLLFNGTGRVNLLIFRTKNAEYEDEEVPKLIILRPTHGKEVPIEIHDLIDDCYKVLIKKEFTFQKTSNLETMGLPKDARPPLGLWKSILRGTFEKSGNNDSDVYVERDIYCLPVLRNEVVEDKTRKFLIFSLDGTRTSVLKSNRVTFCKDLSHAKEKGRDLQKYNELYSILCVKNSELVFLYGDSEALKYRKDHSNRPLQPQSQGNFEKIASKAPVTLLIGPPGMGKSTFLSRWKPESSYVFFISKKISTLTINPSAGLEAIVQLLNLDEDSEFLFRIIYSNKKFHILFFLDGFDEIGERLRKKTIRNLSELLKKRDNLHLLISSRPSEEYNLVSSFSSSPFYLKPLDEYDQKSYLKKMWCLNAWTSKEDSIVEEIRRNLGPEFIQSPLHLYMLMKTYSPERSLEHFPDNIYDFYSEFMERKYQICYEEKKLPFGKILDAIMGTMKLSVRNCIGNLMNNLELPAEYNQAPIEDILLLGIVMETTPEIKFVHMSLCEYFASKYIMIHLKDPHTMNGNIYRVLVHIILDHTGDYAMIQSFLNSKNLINEFRDPKMHKSILKEIKSKVNGAGTGKVRNPLSSLIERKNFELVKFILECVKTLPSIRHKLLFHGLFTVFTGENPCKGSKKTDCKNHYLAFEALTFGDLTFVRYLEDYLAEHELLKKRIIEHIPLGPISVSFKLPFPYI